MNAHAHEILKTRKHDKERWESENKIGQCFFSDHNHFLLSIHISSNMADVNEDVKSAGGDTIDAFGFFPKK